MADNPTVNEDLVVTWLRSHSDLLQRHPDLLDTLEIPHGISAQSLIEIQVERLRKENRKLRAQLETLAGIAGENERLMQRLHQLTLEIMTTRSTREFIERLIERLASDFEALSVRLHLLCPHPALETVDAVTVHEDAPPKWFEKVIESGRIEFGRLTRAKLSALFPNRHESIGSAALVPISATGLLAIGAPSAGRFHPGMGTLFLELLGTTIRHRLEQGPAGQRKRA